MKITIWQPKSPVTVDDMKSDFARKIGAFRAVTGRPERFVTRCACAIHDKGFTVVYERPDPARPFIITGIYKDGEGDATASVAASRSRKVPVADVDPSGWRCPYCGNGLHVGCHQCHTTVCGGKTRRYPGTSDVFTCRASCGARGMLIDAPTVEGIEAARKPLGSKPMAERLPAPGADRRRLGGSKAPRLR